jgi:hypothetical protein
MHPAKSQWALVSGDSSEIEMELFFDPQKEWEKRTSQHEAFQVCPIRFTVQAMHYASTSASLAAALSERTRARG